MSMPGSWDLEERTEDAIVAYIKQECGGVMMVIASAEVTEVQYPLVRVFVETSRNTTEDGKFTGRRQMSVMVKISTENINNNGDPGTQEYYMTAREQHRQIKSSVISALAGSDIKVDLNAVGSEGIEFSTCQMEEQTRDNEDLTTTTNQTLLVIAQPKEL